MTGKRRRDTSHAETGRQMAVYVLAHKVAHLSDLWLLSDTAIEPALLLVTRQLQKLLERDLLKRRPRGANVVDVAKILRRRAIHAALDGSPDDPEPPRRITKLKEC